MRKRTFILPAVLVICLVMAVCIKPLDADPVEKKIPPKLALAKENSRTAVSDVKRYEVTKACAAEFETDEDLKEAIVEKPVEKNIQLVESEESQPAQVEDTCTTVENNGDFVDISEEKVENPVEIVDNTFASNVERAVDASADSDISEEMLTPAEEFAYRSHTLLGCYRITHYSAEECGNSIGAAEVTGGLVEGLSIAMPDEWLLGRTVLVENYGYFRVDDISPSGIADIYHVNATDAIGEDWQAVYLVEEY